MRSTASVLSNNIDSARPWYAHLWPWLLMLGPLTVVVAGIYTGWLAFSRQDALVVDDYYKQGKAINQDLRRDHAATNLALKTEIHYDAAAGRIIGSITSGSKPYSGMLLIHLVHSTQPEKDIHLEAQADSGGRFSVALPMLEIAHWQVLVENERHEWRLVGAWTWPQQHVINISADPPPAE